MVAAFVALAKSTLIAHRPTIADEREIRNAMLSSPSPMNLFVSPPSMRSFPFPQMDTQGRQMFIRVRTPKLYMSIHPAIFPSRNLRPPRNAQLRDAHLIDDSNVTTLINR